MNAGICKIMHNITKDVLNSQVSHLIDENYRTSTENQKA